MTPNTPVPAPTVAMTWTTYQRKGVIEARPWTAEESAHYQRFHIAKYIANISPSVNSKDRLAATTLPPVGFVARNPDNHADQWYIAPDYFAKHYASTPPEVSGDGGHHIPNSDIVRLIEWRGAYMEQDDRRDIRELLNELLQRRLRSAAPVRERVQAAPVELTAEQRIALRIAANTVCGKIGDGSLSGGKDRDAKFQQTVNVIEAMLACTAAPSAQSEADARDALSPHAKWLRQVADEIHKAGHNGWGNTCAFAADAIAAARAALEQEVAILRDALALAGRKQVELLARLAENEALARDAKDAWQPIETAPRDGKDILLFADIKMFHPPHGRISVGQYSTDPVYVGDKLCGLEEGWKGEEDDCIPINQHIFTHWQPLPAPPSTASNAGKAGDL